MVKDDMPLFVWNCNFGEISVKNLKKSSVITVSFYKYYYISTLLLIKGVTLDHKLDIILKHIITSSKRYISHHSMINCCWNIHHNVK